ncbi:unnamed protein product, partial [Musa textilis]
HCSGAALWVTQIGTSFNRFQRSESKPLTEENKYGIRKIHTCMKQMWVQNEQIQLPRSFDQQFVVG